MGIHITLSMNTYVVRCFLAAAWLCAHDSGTAAEVIPLTNAIWDFISMTESSGVESAEHQLAAMLLRLQELPVDTAKSPAEVESNYLAVVGQFTNSAVRGRGMFELAQKYYNRADEKSAKCIEYAERALNCPLTEQQVCQMIGQLAFGLKCQLNEKAGTDEPAMTSLRLRALTTLLQGLKITQAKVRFSQLMRPPPVGGISLLGSVPPGILKQHEAEMKAREEVDTSNEFLLLQMNLKSALIDLYRCEPAYKGELAYEGRQVLGDSALLREILTAVEKPQ